MTEVGQTNMKSRNKQSDDTETDCKQTCKQVYRLTDSSALICCARCKFFCVMSQINSPASQINVTLHHTIYSPMFCANAECINMFLLDISRCFTELSINNFHIWWHGWLEVIFLILLTLSDGKFVQVPEFFKAGTVDRLSSWKIKLKKLFRPN